MMSIKNIFLYCSLFVFLVFVSSCSSLDPQQEDTSAIAYDSEVPVESSPAAMAATPIVPLSLPVQYQTPTYMVEQDSKDDLFEIVDSTIKVGASIRSTRGPQPLWDILKRLAGLKKMNVSWASDVDQNVLVDVDINANDDFYASIENLLRQVDYFHEMQGNTIVVKYKETRRFHIAMPFTTHNYTTATGGNILGSDPESANIDGTIELNSKDNEFDIWKNIQENMDAIISTWNTTLAAPSSTDPAVEGEGEAETQVATRRFSSGGNMYLIDKPIGMVTVSAPRPLLDQLEIYFNTLKKELYKQISIEAKIIEVLLTDSSTIGINWSNVLKDFAINGAVEFGTGGQIYPYIFASENNYNETGKVYSADGSTHVDLHDPGRFVSKVSLDTANFGVFLNALNEQGDAKILSNPKISVMNGQPALITVGRNVTYIDSIDSELDSDTGIVTYTVNTERILSGIGMALTATVLDDNEIIMNLVPVTSELLEPIEYRDVGTLGGTVGLPIVNVREMSTTVKVKDGEMLVIGGLISNVDDTTGEFAPVLGDIPLVRYLFGYEEKVSTKRELIILLKPRII